MKTALVTIAIGEKYAAMFNEFSRTRFENYAARHGYEPIVIESVIRDLPGKKFTWQKCCLLDIQRLWEFDKIAFLDSDTMIAKDAPALPDVTPGKIAGVMDKPPAGLNSGVLLFCPGPAVRGYFEEALLDTDPFWDQVAIERVLRRENALELIDPRFHCMFYVRSFKIFPAVFRKNWIYHALHGKSKLQLIRRLLQLQGR